MVALKRVLYIKMQNSNELLKAVCCHSFTLSINYSPFLPLSPFLLFQCFDYTRSVWI